MSWSQIQPTTLARVVSDYITNNSAQYKLTYHNIAHVAAMYAYLEKSNEPYDECLDWAILFHDAVYDDKPQKELRSAELFINYSTSIPGCMLNTEGRNRVVDLIMSTVEHIATNPYLSPIIRADLAELASPVNTFHNYSKILEESKNLYSITDIAFAEANIAYMRKLRNSVNINWSNDTKHSEFYALVKRGINHTINISKMIQGYDCGEI